MKLVVLEGGTFTLPVLFKTDRMHEVIPVTKNPLSSSFVKFSKFMTKIDCLSAEIIGFDSSDVF